MVVGLAFAPAVLIYLPFLVIAPDGVLDSFGRQLGRPLQIESLGAGVLLALHHAVGMSLDWSSGSGSQNLEGTVPTSSPSSRHSRRSWRSGWCGSGLPEARRRRSASSGTRPPSVVAFVALSKVLSPQFLVWLVLLVPLVGGPRRRVGLALTAVACALTAVWFPARYWELVREFDPLASWLVLFRGVTLVALLAVLTVPATEREPARSRSPAPSPGRT